MNSSTSALTPEESRLLAHLQGLAAYQMLTPEMVTRMEELETRHQESLSQKALSHGHLNKLKRVRLQTESMTDKIRTMDKEWIEFLQEANLRLSQHASMYQNRRNEMMEALAAKMQELANIKAEVSNASQSLVASIPQTEVKLEPPEVRTGLEEFQQRTHMLAPVGDALVEVSNIDDEEMLASPSQPPKPNLAPKPFRASPSIKRVANQALKLKGEKTKERDATKDTKETKSEE